MSESNWITARDPKYQDTSSGYVWVSNRPTEQPHVCHYSKVNGRPWMPASIPSPYEPPLPDTLDSSIEFCERIAATQKDPRHVSRVIEAARKWNEYISNAAVQSPSNDPDGVGDSWKNWEHCEWHEADQVFTAAHGWITGCDQSKGRSSHRRRRIDSDKYGKSVGVKCRKCGGFQSCDVESHKHSSNAKFNELEGWSFNTDDGWTCQNCKPQPTERQERREYYVWADALAKDTRYIATISNEPNGGIHVREVLPGDPDPKWVEELIDLCEMLSSALNEQGVVGKYEARLIANHLAKRGE